MSEYIIKAADWAIDYKGESLFKGCEEIVRCRDCRRRRTIDLSVYYYGEHKHDLDICTRVNGVQLNAEPDGFCAWGERRMDD